MTDIPEILTSPTSPPAGEDSATDPVSVAATNGDEEAADVGAKVISSTVPSGYTISYYPKTETQHRHYRIDDVEVPSVTTITDVLKKDLTWWGQEIGVKGALAYFENWGTDPELDPTVEMIVDWMKESKLTVNNTRDKAATRGTNVHKALEIWAETGTISDPDDFPEEEQGYVRAVNAFLSDCKGRLEPIYSELMVGSKEYGFAGRFDLFAQSEGFSLKTGPRSTREIPVGKGLWDLKTAKKIRAAYDSHKLQVGGGYRHAFEESGYGRSDYEVILQVAPNGRYDVKISDKRPDHFLAVKRAWEALQ